VRGTEKLTVAHIQELVPWLDMRRSTMSKCMQITVAVTPFYQEEFGRTYPKLARHLGYLDAALVKNRP